MGEVKGILSYSNDFSEDPMKKCSQKWRKGDLILGLYKILSASGKKHFCIDYKVIHKNWNKPLTVRTINPGLIENKELMDTFIKELSGWITLGSHPSIISCYYIRELDGAVRIFLEYFEGNILENCKEDLTLKEILDLSIQCLYGLAFSHEKGVLHLNVNPSCCFISAGGELKISDFSITSSFLKAGISIEGSGKDLMIKEELGGTPAYMSPEQWSKEASPGPEADIYSLGVMLYEMCCSVHPFYEKGKSSAVLKVRHQTVEPSLPHKINKDIPESLSQFIMKCLSKNPGDRFRTCREAGKLLKKIYKDITGEKYFRFSPKENELRLSVLNNRALSIMDLGREKNSIKLWERVLSLDESHLEAGYNYNLTLWRSGEITDQLLLSKLKKSFSPHKKNWKSHYLLSLIHTERGAIKKALEILEKISPSPEVESLLKEAGSFSSQTPRCVRTFKEHKGEVTSVFMNEDRNRIISADKMAVVKIWNMETNKCIKTFEGSPEGISSAIMSNDGSLVFSGSYKGALKSCDLTSENSMIDFKGHKGEVSSLALSADGKLLVSGSSDCTVKLWDGETGRSLLTMEGHKDKVTAILISDDSKRIISASYDGTIKFWDRDRGKCLFTLEGHKDKITSLAQGDDSSIISASMDSTIKKWDIKTGKCILTFTGHKGRINALSSDLNRKYLISGSYDGRVILWNLHTGRCLRTFKGHSGSVSSLFLSHRACWMATGGKDKYIKLWNIELLTGKEGAYRAPFMLCKTEYIKKEEDPERARFDDLLELAEEAYRDGSYEQSLFLIAESRKIAGYERAEEAMDLWNKVGSYMIRKSFRNGWHRKDYAGHNSLVGSLAVSRDRRFIITGSDNNTLELRRGVNGKYLRGFKGHSSSVNSVVLTEDSLFALSASDDGTLILWDVTGGEAIRTFEGHEGYVRSVVFSPDEKWCLSGGYDSMVKLWDVSTGECIRSFEGHRGGVNSVAFSFDGLSAISGSQDNTVRLWKIETGGCLQVFKGHARPVTEVAFRADGRRIISSSMDNTVTIWNPGNGKSVRTFRGHDNGVTSFKITPDGKWIFSGSKDGTIRLWETISGKCLKVFSHHRDSILSLAITPDVRFLFSRSTDRTIKLWELDWEFEPAEPQKWDEGARPYIENFIISHTPFHIHVKEKSFFNKEAVVTIDRNGRASWDEKAFEGFLDFLKYAGYGWIDPQGVKEELEKSAAYKVSSPEEGRVSPEYRTRPLSSKSSYKTSLLNTEKTYETRPLSLENNYETTLLKAEQISSVEDRAIPREWTKGDIILDTYEVLDVSGKEIFEKVYKVFHRFWNKKLIVKPVNKTEDEKLNNNFTEKCDRWIELGVHPNIAACYYTRNLGGILRVFSEDTEGASLYSYIKSRKFNNIKDILDVGLQCFDALCYAFDRGLIHNNINPFNCLIYGNYNVKIKDFALSPHILDRSLKMKSKNYGCNKESSEEEEREIIPDYTAPEQLSGLMSNGDGRSDIYSLGVILYEMCCSVHPLILKARHLKIVNPAEINKEVPPDFSKFLLKCISKSPEERFQSFSEARKELLKIYEDTVGKSYFRTVPEEKKLLLYSLNNRAVSLTDISKEEEAILLWEKALKIAPDHIISIYNHSLFLWRRGLMADDAFAELVKEALEKGENKALKHIPGYVSMERNDFSCVINCFRESEKDGFLSKDLKAILNKARELLPDNDREEGEPFSDNPDQVISISLNSDGTKLVSSSSDRNIRLWDVNTKKVIYPFKENYSMISSVALSEDCLIVLSGSYKKLLKLWDVKTARAIRVFEGHKAEVTSVSLSSDARLALSGSNDRTVKLWEVTSGKCIRTFQGHRGEVSYVYLSSDGRLALSGSYDKTVKLWDTGTGECIRTFEGHSGEVSSVVLSSDCRKALSGSHDRTLRLWDMASGRCIKVFTGHKSEVSSVSLSKDCLWALSGGYDRTVRLWQVDTGRCLRTFQGHSKGVSTVVITGDGQRAFSGSSDYSLREWKVGQFIKPDENYKAPFLLCNFETMEEYEMLEVKFHRFLKKAEEERTAGNYEEALNIIGEARALSGYKTAGEALDLENLVGSHMIRKSLKTVRAVHVMRDHSSVINSVFINKDYILSAGHDRAVKLWDKITGNCLKTFEGHKGAVEAAVMTSDCKYILSGGYDMSVRLWDLEKGKSLRAFDGHTARISSLALTSDDLMVISAADDHSLKLWKVVSGTLVRTFEERDSEIYSVSLSKDNRMALSTGCDRRFFLWKMDTGKYIRIFKGHKGLVSSSVFSGDGKSALSGSYDMTLKLWNVSTGECMKTFEGHSGEVSSVAISPDGKWALSGSYDRTLRLWDLEMGKTIYVFEGHSDDIMAVALSEDMRWVLSGSKDKTLRLWELEWNYEMPEEKHLVSKIFGFFKK